MSEPKPQAKKQESPLLNLLINVVLPVVILKKADEWLGLEPVGVLLLALAFPVGYFFYDFARARRVNLFSILGFVSVILTGGIGLLDLPPFWIIVKEGSLPLIIGIVVLGSAWTKRPLAAVLLYNEQILRIDRIDERLEASGKRSELDAALRESTWLLALSFLVSSILQFILASLIVKTDPKVDKARFLEELGDMNWISYLVILVPTMIILAFALWRLLGKIRAMTGLSMEEIMPGMEEEKPKEAES